MGSVPGIPSTAVPPIQFTPQGVILPAESDILAGVQIDINYAFGGGVNPALTTPQGQLATSETAIIADKDSQIAFVVNQIDPQFATGRFQDAIGRIYFMTRIAAVATVVQCVLTGPPGTIAAGTLAQDTSGNTYVLTASVTIPSGGTVLSSWQNIVTGPIPCPEGTLSKPFQASGFDTISNPSDGEIGNLVESAQAFEFRRQQSVALNGRGTTQSINAAVFGVPEVIDCYVIDNPSGNTVSSNPLPGGTPNSTNYALLPHSIYVAVVGGASAAIAQAIWSKKDAGCNYNGNTSVVVSDTDGYDFPFPSYNVQYNIPTALPILFAVSLVNSATLPSNIVALIQAAIIAQFNGTNGAARARIASLILAASYYGVVASAASNVQLISILIGTSAATLTSVQVGIDQTPSITAGNISVTLV